VIAPPAGARPPLAASAKYERICQFWLTADACQSRLTSVDQATDLAEAATHDDPEVGLAAVVALRGLLEQLEALQVKAAREQGWTWQRIAQALGVTRQSVHKKYAGGRLRGRRS
jgi:DNA-directed RNA polymerase specialized sigma24 family protein